MISNILSLYKNAYTGLSKRMWLLSIVMLINRSGSMVLAFMTIYCIHIGFSIKQGGLVVALYGIGSLLGALAGGKISDKYGFYYTQFFSLFFGGIMFVVLGLMKSYQSICVITFFLAMINESFRPANASAIAHYSTLTNRTQSFSLVRLAINLGWTVGSALGGFLAAINYHLLFWVDGCTNIMAAFLLVLILPKVSKIQQQKPPENVVTLSKFSSPYTDKKFLFFIFLQIIFGICFFQIFTTIPVFFKINLHLSEFNIGASMAASGIMIALFEMLLIHNLEGKKSYPFFMSIGTLIIALAFLILNIPLANGIVIAVSSLLVITLGEMLSIPFMNSFYITRSTTLIRGQYAGIYTMAWSAAQALGSIGGAAFADKYGFNNLWILIFIMASITAFGYFYLQKIKD